MCVLNLEPEKNENKMEMKYHAYRVLKVSYRNQLSTENVERQHIFTVVRLFFLNSVYVYIKIQYLHGETFGSRILISHAIYIRYLIYRQYLYCAVDGIY